MPVPVMVRGPFVSKGAHVDARTVGAGVAVVVAVGLLVVAWTIRAIAAAEVDEAAFDEVEEWEWEVVLLLVLILGQTALLVVLAVVLAVERDEVEDEDAALFAFLAAMSPRLLSFSLSMRPGFRWAA